MLEPNFTPPNPEESGVETQKRLDELAKFKTQIKDSATSLIVAGSMGYGQNYSVKKTSDLDMILFTNKDLVDNLSSTGLFNAEDLNHAVSGYKKDLYKQFSLVFESNNIPMECHFWDQEALIDALLYKSESTKRLRSGVDTPSTDYAHSFSGKEDVKDYFGEMIEGYPVADFPTYRMVDDVVFLCRPITNILGHPLVVFGDQKVLEAIETCWNMTIKKLVEYRQHDNQASIINALPGKIKVAPVIMKEIEKKQDSVLDNLDL